jgi:hypothetical protein
MIPWLARNTVFILGTNELPFVSRAVFPIRDQLLLDRFHCKMIPPAQTESDPIA